MTFTFVPLSIHWLKTIEPNLLDLGNIYFSSDSQGEGGEDWTSNLFSTFMYKKFKKWQMCINVHGVHMGRVGTENARKSLNCSQSIR